MEVNVYGPPQLDVSITQTEEETLRRHHLIAEGAVKSIGVLLILGALDMIASAGTAAPAAMIQIGLLSVPTAFLLIFGAIQAAVGIGMGLLWPWSRIPGILVCSLGLLNFPVGTIFCSLFLYYLANPRGTFVLSPGYRAIVAATPHVKRKTSWVMIVLFIILLTIILGSVILGVVMFQVGSK